MGVHTLTVNWIVSCTYIWMGIKIRENHNIQWTRAACAYVDYVCRSCVRTIQTFIMYYVCWAAVRWQLIKSWEQSLNGYIYERGVIVLLKWANCFTCAQERLVHLGGVLWRCDDDNGTFSTDIAYGLLLDIWN